MVSETHTPHWLRRLRVLAGTLQPRFAKTLNLELKSLTLSAQYPIKAVIGAQFYMPCVNDDFACVFEVHGDVPADVGLHLPQPPVGLRRVPHQHSGFK